MAKVSSLSAPGVEVREYDNSLRITSNTGTTVFVPGYAAQGPVEEIIQISSITDFESIYGIPTNAAERYFYYTCLAVLNNSGQGSTLLTSRLPYGSGEGDNVANAYTMLVYPAIPVTKNSEDSKSYTYYKADADKVAAHFKVSAKSPVVKSCEVIINSAKDNGSAFSITGVTSGDIPTVISTGADITTKTKIAWKYGETTATSDADLYAELVDGKIILHVAAQLVTTTGDMYGCVVIELSYEDENVVNLFNTEAVKVLATDFDAADAAIEFTKVVATKVASSLTNDEDTTYVIGAPAAFNVSLSEYYQIVTGEFFKWSANVGDMKTFGTDMATAMASAAFIAINTSRSIINDSYEGLYFGITDNLFNEPSDDYALNSVSSVKFTSWNRANDKSFAGIVDGKNSSEFISIDRSRLDFFLDTSNKGSISDVLQTSTTSFNTSDKEYDDTVNLGIFKLAKSSVSNEAMKLGYNVVEKYNASLGKTRTYSTANTTTAQSYYIENVIGDSANLTILVNPYIADKIKIDINGDLRGKVRFLSSKIVKNVSIYENEYLGSTISATSDNLSKRFGITANNLKNWATLCARVGVEPSVIKTLAEDTTTYPCFNLNDSLYPFATYTVVKKNNKYIGSTPSKISRVLELISNDEVYPDIDLVLEGGLGTVYAYSNNPKMLISEGSSSVIHLEDGDPTDGDNGENNNIFNDDAILQGIEDLRTSRSSLTADAQKVIDDYMAVQNAFLSLANSFQNGGRGDSFYIADTLRGIVLRGADTKVEKLFGTPLTNNVYSSASDKVNHSWATSIYNPIKHTVDALTSSYASIYAQWVKINDGFTNQRHWVPVSGYMAALMCAADQLHGPWFAAAGLNRGIVNGVLDCAINPNQKQRGDLYKICVNSVPKLAGIGITCWGIRTLSKKASAFDQNTCRRTFLFIEKAVKKLLRYYLFEPNNSYTQLSIYNEIEPYMESIRNQGGVYSYQIVCNASNNSEDIVNAGNLAVDISAAPTRTAEFIVLNMTANKYTQSVATSEFVG